MLILFDIDGTLIATGGVGERALAEAGRELFGPAFTCDGTEIAGRLDPAIMADLLVANAIDAGRFEDLRDGYRRHLVRLLPLEASSRALPGVMELLALLEEVPGLTLGLLTGNYELTGAIKLRACGVDPARFRLAVWGNDSPFHPPQRTHLPAVALGRYKTKHGRAIEPGKVVIIGDTPHDVACAKAIGCRGLGVATGRFGVEELTRCGADLALPSLADARAVREWIVKGCST